MRISYPYRSISGANITNGEANRAWRSQAMKRSRTIDIRTVNPQNTQLIARNAMTSEPNTENPHAQQQIIERRMHVDLQQIHHSGEWLALHNERIPLVEPDGTADAQRERPAGCGDRAYRRDTGKTMLRNGLSYRHGVVSLFIVQTYGGTSVLENAMAMVGIGVSHHSHAAWRMRHVSASPDRRRHAGSVP